MVMRIRTNVPALNGLRNLNNVTSDLATSIQRLTSGLRINSAADDPAGLATATRFKVQIASIQQASRNAQQGVSLIQTADGALTSIQSMLQEIYTLAVQSANDTNTSLDRATIQTEVNDLISEVNRMASGTEFNDINLLNGDLTTSLAFLVGTTANDVIRFGMQDTRASSIGVGTVDVSTASAANAALNQIGSALSIVTSRQAKAGSVQNRLNYAINYLATANLNYESARSAIEDTDIAYEVTNYSRLQVMSTTSTAYLAQANLMPGNVMNLLVFNNGG